MGVYRYGGPIPVDEEEQSFPRGGQQQLTPLEKSIIKTQAERDVLFNEVSSVNLPCSVN